MIIPSVEQQRQEPERDASTPQQEERLVERPETFHRGTVEWLRARVAEAVAIADEHAASGGREREQAEQHLAAATRHDADAVQARQVADEYRWLLQVTTGIVDPLPSLGERVRQALGPQSHAAPVPASPAVNGAPYSPPHPVSVPAYPLHCTKCGRFLREEAVEEAAVAASRATPRDTSQECPHCTPRPPQAPPAAAPPRRPPYIAQQPQPSPPQPGPGTRPGNDTGPATRAEHEAVWRGTHPGAEET